MLLGDSLLMGFFVISDFMFFFKVEVFDKDFMFEVVEVFILVSEIYFCFFFLVVRFELMFVSMSLFFILEFEDIIGFLRYSFLFGR